MGISPIAKSIENIHKCREKYLKCRNGNYYINKLTDSLWVNLSIGFSIIVIRNSNLRNI